MTISTQFFSKAMLPDLVRPKFCFPIFIYFIFLQVWYSNPALRDWLKDRADASELDKLKWMYYAINKSPW